MREKEAMIEELCRDVGGAERAGVCTGEARCVDLGRGQLRLEPDVFRVSRCGDREVAGGEY